MGYAGVKDPQERADLIAYLKQATRDPKICK
jgi:cytochrome c2